jgi:tight adherence protein B
VLVIFAAVLKLPLWLVGPLCLVAFFGVPRFLLSREQKRAEATFTDLFPSAIDLVIRMLRAGLPISAAIRAVAAEGPARVDKVFARIADQVDIGVPLPDALAEQSRRINLADFRFFAIAVNLQHTTGGNLTLTLEILAEIIRKRRGARMRAKAVTAEVRMTAYVLAGIPVFVVVALLVFDPGYLSPLLHDPRGNVVGGAAAGSLTAGLVMMRQMMNKAMRV